jgi:hypothetical protein
MNVASSILKKIKMSLTMIFLVKWPIQCPRDTFSQLNKKIKSEAESEETQKTRLVKQNEHNTVTVVVK